MKSSLFSQLTGGRLAFLLSLALHVALALFLTGLSSQSGRKGTPAPNRSDCLALNFVAIDPEDEDRSPLQAQPAKAVRPRPPAAAPAPREKVSTPEHPAREPRAAFAQGQRGAGAEEKVGRSEFGSDYTPSSGPVAAAGGGAAGGGQGGGGAFFVIAARVESVVYVIDRSNSMALGGRLAAARRELLASLGQLPATARFQVIFYNQSPTVLPLGGAGLVPATLENKRRVTDLLNEYPPEGGTDHLPALKEALALQPDVIFFLTDADDLTEKQVGNVTRINHERNQGRTRIHTIELTTENRGRTDMPLQVLARSNGGTYLAVTLEDR